MIIIFNRVDIKAQTLKDKFYIAGKRIGKALDISARLDEIMKDEDDYSIVIDSGYVNVPRENEYWGTFRIIFGRMLPAIFVWPILTPLITIIILSVHILYHAATALMVQLLADLSGYLALKPQAQIIHK